MNNGHIELNNCENAYYEQALMQEIPTYKNTL